LEEARSKRGDLLRAERNWLWEEMNAKSSLYKELWRSRENNSAEDGNRQGNSVRQGKTGPGNGPQNLRRQTGNASTESQAGEVVWSWWVGAATNKS